MNDTWTIIKGKMGKIPEKYKIPFGWICYIGWAWKPIVKVRHFNLFMGKNTPSTKGIFFSFFPKYDTWP